MKSTWTMAATIALAAFLGLAGCSGDDGRDGAPGAPGAPGELGPPGEQGPPGEGLVATPIESCAVCHSEGSINSAPAAHEVFDVGAFADFAVSAVGADLVINFSATLDGVPPVGATLYRAYAWDGAVRTTLRAPGRGSTLPVDLVVFAETTIGNYTVTIPGGVALFQDDDLVLTNQRYLMILRAGDNQLEVVAYGDYPNAIPLAGLASNQACVACHGDSGEVGRFAPTRAGGHYSAPMTVDACVVCHINDNPLTPENEAPGYGGIVELIHGIHNSHDADGTAFLDEYDVTYPTYMTNCSVCHSDDNELPALPGVSALAAANAMPVTGAGCFTCHGSMDGFDFTGLEFHLNIPTPETANCAQCHNPPAQGGVARYTVAQYHNSIVTGNDGIIFNGVDTSVTEGAKFVWKIDGIVDDGTNLEISWSATYDGVGVNPCNATVGTGAPVFHADGDGNLSMLRNYFQGDDPILGLSTSAPGQPTNVGVTVANTTCSGNVATTTIPVEAVDAERGIVALQGKPRVVSVLDPTAAMEVRAVTPTYEWLVGSGDAPLMVRRDVVDTEVCLTCHVGSLYQHGGNRVDNVEMCNLCHNPASNEQSVRVGLGVDPSEAYDGKVGETFEMKTMLHRIHSAGTEGSPLFVIYRGRGIYAFAPDESLLPATWPGTGPQIVFGSEGDRVINHNFHSPTYPRALNACTACHTEDFAVLPDGAKAMATTIDAGSTEWRNQLDDTLQGVTTTACITCHTDSASRGHALQNSWVPQEFPEGRQTIIDAAQ